MNSKKKHEPRVAIIILNFNGYEDTIECIDSIRQIEYTNYEIILIDNNSSDGSYSRLEKLNNIHLLKSDNNIGFAGGNNLGLEYALKKDFDLFLLLNNDTVVEKYFLNELINCMEKDASVGICGSKIYYYQNKSKIWSAGGGISKILKRTFQYGENKIDNGHFDLKRDVAFLSGCCMLVNRAVLEKAGMLDTDYFLYYEDVDLCLRAKDNGFKIVYSPDSVIWHKVSGSTTKSRRDYYRMRNYFLFLKKRYSANLITRIALGIIMLCERVARILARKIYYRDKENLTSRLSAIGHGWFEGLTYQK